MKYYVCQGIIPSKKLARQHAFRPAKIKAFINCSKQYIELLLCCNWQWSVCINDTVQKVISVVDRLWALLGHGAYIKSSLTQLFMAALCHVIDLLHPDTFPLETKHPTIIISLFLQTCIPPPPPLHQSVSTHQHFRVACLCLAPCRVTLLLPNTDAEGV